MLVTKNDVARYIARGKTAVDTTYPCHDDVDNCVDTIMAVLYLCRSRNVDPFAVIDTVRGNMKRELFGKR